MWGSRPCLPGRWRRWCGPATCLCCIRPAVRARTCCARLRRRAPRAGGGAPRAARARGVRVVARLGKGGGTVRRLVDDALVIPADEASHIQELHLAIEHIICAIVEEQMTQ